MSRPNILFIISDQHNARCLGHAGHPEVKTPHIDRLADEGTAFDRCVTANAICTPSRMSFLSGQYCHNHGYYGLSGPNPHGLPTIFGHLRTYGYRTAAIGKIHCPEYWVEDDCDVYHETCGEFGDITPPGCSRDGRSPDYARHLREHGWSNEEEHTGYPEFDRFGKGRQSLDGRPSKLPFSSSQEGWIASTATEFIRNSEAAGEPWIAQCSFPRPHQVAAPCQEFWDLYETDLLSLPPSCDAELYGKAPHLMKQRDVWRKANWPLFEPNNFSAARRRKLHAYYGAISQVDAAVGQLLQTLDELNIADNTLVIYTSDHGDYACQFDIMEKSPGICADAVTRIPFIWRGPGIQAGVMNHHHVESVDLSQTICDWAGADPLATSDGTSLRPLLSGENCGSWQKTFGVTEFAWSKSIRQDNYRLVIYPQNMFPEEYPNGFMELYDLEADPWEMHNLALDTSNNPELTDRIAQMKNNLYDWLVTTTRPVSSLGVQTPPAVKRQCRRRFQRDILADGKMDTRWIANRRTNNYL